ncbi:MAG: Flp pilus assembly protein RcpC/CpaB [Actinomycetota bacterium]|jgi:Flp pilus assembly protein CpaB|nr:Flp pilus assembly protein RcpC/CpaB [Actinomycetota bacterium]
MRSRGLVVGIALVLAIVAAAAVILYTQKVKEDAAQGGSLVDVVVATQDIPANTALNTLPATAFTTAHVPTAVVVAGAVTDPAQLQGQITSGLILANEQIPLSRLSNGSTEGVSSIGVSQGNVGVTVKLEGDAGGDGVIHAGDNIVVYANYTGASVISGSGLKPVIQGKPLPPNASSQTVPVPTFTAAIIPSVKVLRVQNPAPDANGVIDTGASIILTLDLTPQDAENLVFAQENASVWVGLLHPGDDGTQLPPSLLPIDFLLKAKGIA